MGFWLGIGVALWLAGSSVAGWAFNRPESEIDPAVFRIDEQKFMGVKFGKEVNLVDHQGQVFTMADLPNLPTLLLLSYYRCDGSCAALNTVAKELLPEVTRMPLGEGFQVVTLSFDRQDTTETARAFRQHLELPPAWEGDWRFALFQDPAQIKQETDKIGFKFFWSPPDRTFFHPMVMVVLTREGRVSRYLNALNTSPLDLQLALLEAKQGQFHPSEAFNYAMSLCYSYNFKEGRYVLNISTFVGFGSMVFGLGALAWSIYYYRRKQGMSMEERV